jgi:hypothetical protein
VNSPVFVTHTGVIKNLARLHPRTLFVLDSNVVLTLTNNHKQLEKLAPQYLKLLQALRQRAHQSWKVRQAFIPIDPVFAVMELTKQEARRDFDIYRKYLDDFFGKIFNLNDYDPSWVADTYESAMRYIDFNHSSIAETVRKVISLIPELRKPSNEQILQACDSFLDWIWQERDRLTMIGGPLLQAGIYAIAGSPEARRLLKVDRAQRQDADALSRNVAWDFMYWTHLEMNYHFKRYETTVICTSDEALVALLTQRLNTGPRIDPRLVEETSDIDSDGLISGPSLSRIEETHLGNKIRYRILHFWAKIDATTTHDVKFGIRNVRKSVRTHGA